MRTFFGNTVWREQVNFKKQVGIFGIFSSAGGAIVDVGCSVRAGVEVGCSSLTGLSGLTQPANNTIPKMKNNFTIFLYAQLFVVKMIKK